MGEQELMEEQEAASMILTSGDPAEAQSRTGEMDLSGYNADLDAYKRFLIEDLVNHLEARISTIGQLYRKTIRPVFESYYKLKDEPDGSGEILDAVKQSTVFDDLIMDLFEALDRDLFLVSESLDKKQRIPDILSIVQ